MATLPNSLALTSIADGAPIIASDHRNNYTAIQTEANALLAIMGSGLSGQMLNLNGTTVTPIYPPGFEFWHQEATSGTINVTATTEATATTIVTAAALTFDGTMTVMVEFYAPYVAKGTTFTRLYLYDGASSIGFIGHVDASGGVPFRVARKLTPSAAAHTYSIRGSVDAGTGAVVCGAGGVGAYMPLFLRVTKV